MNKKERIVFDELLTKAIEEGFIPNKCAKQIIDSTYMRGDGAVQDTYTLTRKAIAKVSKGLKGRLDICNLNLGLDYDKDVKPDIDWGNAEEREKY